jgi:hypothetical protein
MPKRQAEKDSSVISPVPTKVIRGDEEEDKRIYCAHCKKALHVSATCRCNMVLCLKHLDGISHGCTFDYKAAHKLELLKNNPQIKAEKVASF